CRRASADPRARQRHPGSSAESGGRSPSPGGRAGRGSSGAETGSSSGYSEPSRQAPDGEAKSALFSLHKKRQQGALLAPCATPAPALRHLVEAAGFHVVDETADVVLVRDERAALDARDGLAHVLLEVVEGLGRPFGL